jgi:argininosuccinate synthase
VADRFAAGSPALSGDEIVVQFQDGIPTNINHRNAGILEILTELNSRFRRADWAWDLVIENRVVGIKSRGLYINPAAKLLAVAVDALARCVFNKPTYDLWRSLGQQYGQLLYGGQYFSDQRLVIESAAIPILKRLNGKVTVDVCASPYAASINANDPLFRQSIATFEAGEFDHHDAEGFMKLNWRSSLGRPFDPDQD